MSLAVEVWRAVERWNPLQKRADDGTWGDGAGRLIGEDGEVHIGRTEDGNLTLGIGSRMFSDVRDETDDSGDVFGHTARLNPAAVRELHARLSAAHADGRRRQLAADKEWEEHGTVPDHGDNYEIASGYVSGEGADVHFSVILDDYDVGVQTYLAAIPHSSDATLNDLWGAEQGAEFDATEMRKLLARLGTAAGTTESATVDLWRALEARHNLRGPDGRFIRAGGGSDRPSLADVIRGTAANGPKRQRDNKGGMTIADAVRNAAQMSDTTGRPTQVPAKPRRGRQVPAAVPARLATRVRNPDAPILQQVDEYHLRWPGGTPAGWSQAELDERSRVLDDYMNEVGDASPWNLRGANPSADVRRHLDEVMATSPLTEDVVVWRGLGEPRLLFGDRLDQPDMTGASVTDPSFASTSTSRSAAGEYATQAHTSGGVVVQMHVPAGVGAINLGGDQHEVLVDRDLRWTVTSDSGPGRSPRTVAVRVERSNGGMSVADAELAASRPAPAKRTPPGRRKPVDAAAITAQLDGATSLDEARGHLAGLTVPQLRQIAEHTGVALGSGDTKARVLDRIVNSVVGRRLDSAAITRMTNR